MMPDYAGFCEFKGRFFLTVIGGINWGLIGFFQFDLVAFLCGGSTSVVSRIIYALVGLAALWCISLLFRDEDPVRAETAH